MSSRTPHERRRHGGSKLRGLRPTDAEDSHRALTDRLYFIGVSIKGIDGVLELVLGLALLLVPTLPHLLIETAAARATGGIVPFGPYFANYLEHLDGTLAKWGPGLVVVYLVAHGAIKLLLVTCLLMRLHKVYPVAIGVLAAFLGYEIYLFCVNPGVTLGVFILLDSFIISLVVREYRQLKHRAESLQASGEVSAAAG